jgi:hypothetical protein
MENPAFARTCGFTIRRPGKPERQSDVPSLRKLQKFDQLMTANGLWEELTMDRVAANLREGRIEREDSLVHDTTHYHAYSSRQMVERPTPSNADARQTAASGEDSPAPAAQTCQPVAMVKLDGAPVGVGRARDPAGRGGDERCRQPRFPERGAALAPFVLPASGLACSDHAFAGRRCGG